MGAGLAVRVKGDDIVCTITSDVDLVAPVFCFSLMAPACVLRGGRLVRSVGGYAEIALPDLTARTAHEVVVGYVNEAERYHPVNRAWLPLGPYLRHEGGVTRLPAGPSGAKAWVHGGPEFEPDLRLIPAPAGWRPKRGVIAAAGFATEYSEFAKVNALSNRLALGDFLIPNGVPVSVELDGALRTEAYQISIAQDRIKVSAGDDAGVFYAAITLLNLRALYDGQLPLGEVTDGPRFAWRGQHLDCARHYYQPDTLMRLIDLMAFLKLNRFHWHFSDDEAFRLELDCLPELWHETAMRGDGHPIPGVFGGGVASGGTYSKGFAAELIAHAKALYIEIMPEIEVPAHALALNTAIPGLRDPEDTSGEVSVQGYERNTINPAMPRGWEVVEALIDEIAEIFPFERIHLGCDEPPENMWSGSPAADSLKAREGLVTTDDLQGWMMERLARGLNARGKKPAAWEEAARGNNGGIGNDALLFSWSGQAPGIAAAKAGYDIVMCPAQHLYLDMAQTDRADDWGAAWAAFVPLSETVNWNPVPGALGDAADRIVGVQGEFWSEFTTSDHEIIDMLWPRILGVCTMAWALDRGHGPDDFLQRARLYGEALSEWRLRTLDALQSGPTI